MAYSEDEMLQLSGLQHFAFCRRQWALIYIENTWVDNLQTTDGSLFHKKAHNEQFRAKRGDVLTLRNLSISSYNLGLTGRCDVVEFHSTQNGISLHGEDGLWLPYPVEYKRGNPKTHLADELQLCAQAICLEEMLCCSIPEGALFYGEIRHRAPVVFDAALRNSVVDASREMHDYFRQHHIPKARPTTGCASCSLQNVCLPKINRASSPSSYLKNHLLEGDAL